MMPCKTSAALIQPNTEPCSPAIIAVMVKINTYISSAFLITFILLHVFFPPLAHAQQEWAGVCVGEELGDIGKDVATIQGAQCLIANAFAVIITVIGLAGFVMFVFGAFTWMLSGNNSKGVDNARQAMTYAVIGIVVALSGFIIINLIASFTGVSTITEFRIPSSSTPSE
jgi:hypothetical protein